MKKSRMGAKDPKRSSQAYSDSGIAGRLKDISFFAFFLLLPTQLGKHFFPDFSYVSAIRIDYLAPTLYLTDILAVTVILLSYRAVLRLFINRYFLVFLAFLAFNIVAASSPPLAFYKSLKILEVVFLFRAVWNWFGQGLRYLASPGVTRSWRLVLVALLSGGIVELVLSTLQLYFKHSMQGISYWLGERALSLGTPGVARASLQGIELLRPYGTFSHPNSMAGFFLLVHVFALTFKPLDKYPVLKYALMGISAAIVLISFSKAAIAGLFLVTVLYIFTHLKEIDCKICRVGRPLVAAVVAFIFFQAHGDPLSGQKRIELAQNAWEILKNNLLTGVGLGNYLLEQARFPIKTDYFSLQPVHNIFLLFLAETGMIFSGYLFYLLWRARKLFVDNECLAYVAGAIAFTGMFDHYWLTLQQNLLLAASLLCMALTSAPAPPQNRTAPAL